MTWERIKETGFGTLEFRVKIAGIETEFVTNAQMAQDLTDTTGTGVGGIVKRRLGLLREGLSISEEAILPENKLELGGNTFSIIEDHQYSATAAFFRRPTIFTQLAVDRMPADALTTAITNGTGFSNGDYMWIGSECIRLTSNPVATTTGNYVITMQRGKLGTIAQQHFSRTDLGSVLRPTFQNVPYGIENRRVKLFAYGDGDDLTGDGTQIWQGYIMEDAALADGMKWRFQAGPISEALASEIGNSFEDIKFRGLYWSKREWIVEFQRLDGPMLTDIYIPDDGIISGSFPGSLPTGSIIQAKASGFYEDKWALANDLNAQLVTASRDNWADTTNMGCSVIDGEVAFTFTVDAVDPRAVVARTIDGIHNISTFAEGGEDTHRGGTGGARTFFQEFMPTPGKILPFFNPTTGESDFRFGVEFTTFMVRGETYAWRTRSPIPDIIAPYYTGTPVITPQRDPRRMHVSADSLPEDITDIRVYKAGAAEGETGTSGPSNDNDIEVSRLYASFETNPITVDITNNTLTTRMFGSFLATNEDHYAIVGTRFVSHGNVVDFLEALVEKSPALANQGFVPLISPDDFDLDDMKTVISGVALNSFNANRTYSFFKKGKKLDEILQAEYKLIGVYPALTPDGRMTIRPFGKVTATQKIKHTIGDDDILTDDSYMPLLPNKYGIWNAVSLKTRYDPQRDEHLGNTYVVNNLDSISQNSGKKKTIAIEPISFAAYPLLPETEFIESFLWKETSLLAYKYYVTSVEVPLTFFSSSIGDSVRISNRQLPNPFVGATRRRGTSLAGGVIVGRKFDLDRGFGQLTILLSEEDITGEITTHGIASYAPQVVAAGSSAGSSATITITAAAAAGLFNTLDDVTGHFNVGDAVSLEEFDADVPEISGIGVISGITPVGSAFNIDVNFPTPADIPARFSDGTAQFLFGFPNVNLLTGSTQPSVSQSNYNIIDSGSFTVATGSGETNFEGFAGGKRHFRISF